MEDSVYKVVELVGTSTQSWEDAVNNVVKKAKDSLQDLRVAGVSELDVKIENGEVAAYRAKVKLSFKYNS